MKEAFKFGAILGVICMASAGLLAVANSFAGRKIIAQAQAQEEAGLREVLPAASRFEPVKKGEEIIYYKAKDQAGNFIGVAFKATGKGYSGDIQALAGMLKDGRITAVKILAQDETPGLGTRITEEGFIAQFKGSRDLSGVQAITGATISSRAVIESVHKKAEEVRGLIKE